MANEATDALVSNESLKIPTRDYFREFVGTQMSIIDAKIDMLQRLNVANADATQRAVEKAESQMNKRLEGMNEFRDQLTDQAATFVRNDKFADLKDQIIKSIATIEKGLLSFSKKEDVDATRLALAQRTDEFRAVLQVRVENMEKILANWQGRIIVLASVWSLVVVVAGALLNYAIRTATAPDSAAPVAAVVSSEFLKQAATAQPYASTQRIIAEMTGKIEALNVKVEALQREQLLIRQQQQPQQPAASRR